MGLSNRIDVTGISLTSPTEFSLASSISTSSAPLVWAVSDSAPAWGRGSNLAAEEEEEAAFEFSLLPLLSLFLPVLFLLETEKPSPGRGGLPTASRDDEGRVGEEDRGSPTPLLSPSRV